MSANTTNPAPGQGTTPNKQENPNTPVVPGPSVENRKRGDQVPEVDPNTGLPPVEVPVHEPAPDTGVQPDGTMPKDAPTLDKDRTGSGGSGTSDKR
jgi:hypothetical protein